MKQRVQRHAVVQPLNESYRLIPLTQGQNAIVDVDDFERLSRWNWYAVWVKPRNVFIAVRKPGRQPMILMAREILRPLPYQLVDHKNRNTLDNRKNNLRICDKSRNASNSKLRSDNRSGFRGVFWDSHAGKWRARVCVQNKSVYCGVFDSPEDAAHAYDQAAKRYFGEFATLNFKC